MARHKPITFITPFATYTSRSVLGEGGAGIVYEATDEKQLEVAVKLLDPAKATRERLKRFKNEYLFGYNHVHPQLLRILDIGVLEREGVSAPFYVMPKYVGSLRRLLKAGIRPDDVLAVFSYILSGVEAAHLHKVTHRDLKPENIMANDASDLVVGDFGIARFEEEELYTLVETRPGDRLANFAYAAPEQRRRGSTVDHRADIFALGLMLNELFTGEVPQGVGFRTVESISANYGWLDDVVSQLIQSAPDARPRSVAAVRELLRLKSDQFEAQQRLSELSNTVIPMSEIDDPAALQVPEIVGADFDGSNVVITLNMVVSEGWVAALRNMGSFAASWGAGPEMFRFQANRAMVPSDGSNAQDIVNHFKNWLPQATARLRLNMESYRRQEDERRSNALRAQRQEIERCEKVRASLKF